MSDQGTALVFSPGAHNEVQQAIITDFLPRYGYGAELLMVKDRARKFLVLEQDKLAALRFFEIAHGELPDIIASSASRNWLYPIEAVHAGLTTFQSPSSWLYCTSRGHHRHRLDHSGPSWVVCGVRTIHRMTFVP